MEEAPSVIAHQRLNQKKGKGMIFNSFSVYGKTYVAGWNFEKAFAIKEQIKENFF